MAHTHSVSFSPTDSLRHSGADSIASSDDITRMNRADTHVQVREKYDMCICFAHTNKFSKTGVEDFQRMMLGLVDRRNKKQVMDHERTVFRSPRCLLGPKNLSSKGVTTSTIVDRDKRNKAMEMFLKMDKADIGGDGDEVEGGADVSIEENQDYIELMKKSLAHVMS